MLVVFEVEWYLVGAPLLAGRAQLNRAPQPGREPPIDLGIGAAQRGAVGQGDFDLAASNGRRREQQLGCPTCREHRAGLDVENTPSPVAGDTDSVTVAMLIRSPPTDLIG